MFSIHQKVVFVLGKGGVGRTTVASSLGYYFSQLGLKTLIIQWTIQDSISPLFFKEPVGHKHQEILPNLFVMNYDPDYTLKEYFVDHLKMSFFYKFILENQQVKKLLQATPGLEELFFLGRIFWLVELAKEERGYEFDKIIVDAPATGHGSALFGIISTISNFKLEGPLISEATRVSKMLENPNKIATVIVTLPEELPYEETIELFNLVEKEMKRPPIYIFINRCYSFYINNELFDFQFFNNLEYKEIFHSIYLDIKNKLHYEKKTKEWFSRRVKIISLPDLFIQNFRYNSFEKIKVLSEFLQNYEF